MKLNKVLIYFVIFVILIAAAVCWFFCQAQQPQDLSKVSDAEIISILVKNKDSNDYMQGHKDFTIQDKIVLTKDSILAGQNGQNFKEVYQGLELQNNRYLRVDLINSSGDRGLVAVLDFKTKQTIKAYGIILLKTNG